jgi:alkylation response protein AidB-like acyl-CoA dehydrogenase
MDFQFSQEQEMFRRTIRRYIQKECSPQREQELDDREEFPEDLFRKMASLQLSVFTQEYGWRSSLYPGSKRAASQIR